MDGVIFDFNGTMFFDDAFQTQSWEQFILQKKTWDTSLLAKSLPTIRYILITLKKNRPRQKAGAYSYAF